MALTYPVKIEFKEWGGLLHTTYEDWSQYLATPPEINKRVESENEGEAGVIVFDNAKVTFRYESGNPVHTIFSVDLHEVQRYLFKISFPKADKSYVTQFEGMADFSTIEWNEHTNLISFNIIDKLSALGILYADAGRTVTPLDARILAVQPLAAALEYTPWSDGITIYLQVYRTVPSLLALSLDSAVIFPGEILAYPMYNPPSLNLDHFEYFVVIKNEIVTYNGTYCNKLTVAPFFSSIDRTFSYLGDEYNGEYNCNYCSKEIYGIDINNITGGVLQNLDGIKAIQAIYNKAWYGATITKKPSGFTFNIPSDYAVRMIDESPFGGTPLDAVKTLANSMKCYVYVNREGSLIVQEKASLGTNGTTRSLGTTKIISRKRKYFWDKLVDGITVTIRSWIRDEFGEYLEATVTRTKQVPGSDSYIEPKNSKEITILTSDPNDNTIELLEARAAEAADAFLDFYGNRRSSYDMILNLDDNTIEWDMIDNLLLGADNYFFTALMFSGNQRTLTLEPVEVEGHDYDIRQVLIPLNESTSVQISGGGASGTGTLTQGSLKKEVPSGLINGVNKIFTLVKAPSTSFVFVFKNGVYQEVNEQYSLSDNTITFNKPPIVGDKIRAHYV